MMHRLVLSVLLLTAAAVPALTQDAPRRKFPRVRLGGIVVNAGYTHWSGGGGPWWPGYYGFAGPYGYGYGPMMWGGAYAYPGFWYGYGYADGRGEVKLNTVAKDADVFIDGAFAGSSGNLKSMWLDPGVYEIEVRPDYKKKVYVLGGKTLRLEVKQ